MTNAIIQVNSLGKQYRLGAAARSASYQTMRDAVVGAAARALRRRPMRTEGELFWAIRDVSFQVAKGEVVGIIGRNGAGKSTLLKILSRITDPTEGEIDIYGRVGSLLEVGTGFHPELSGRENVFLNGSILGMKRAEIARQFDAIVAFAEIERFLDTPVKHYSSGMYMRLAFAVAAHLRPEVLIVDEVLAVGDAQFQKKCLGKMGEAAQEGRTVLFVSHNMAAVQALCGRVIWLHDGKIVGDGSAAEVVREYLGGTTQRSSKQVWEDDAAAPQNEFVRLRGVDVVPVATDSGRTLTVHDSFDLVFEYEVLRPGLQLHLSAHVHSRDEVCAFNVASHMERVDQDRTVPIGLYRTACRVPGDLLNNGRHKVTLLFVRDASVVVFQISDVLYFDIEDSPTDRRSYFGEWPGVVRPRLEWKTELMPGKEGPNPNR